jgi:hypothetical protein
VYATSAGSVAQDGSGRNGLYTSHLLNHLKTPGLEVKEIFNRTGDDVIQASKRMQIPAVYSQFFKSAHFDNSVQAPPTCALAFAPPPEKRHWQANWIQFYELSFRAWLIFTDIAGGVIVTSGYAAAIGLIAWELSMSGGESAASVPGNIGTALGIGAITFGFIKPFIFNYNHKLASASGDFDISLVSNERNNSALSLRYKHSF